MSDIIFSQESAMFDIPSNEVALSESQVQEVCSVSCAESEIAHVDGEDGDDYDDAEDGDPGVSFSGIGVPEAIPAEPGFLARFSKRFTDILNDDRSNFEEFESKTKDFIDAIKTELNFKIYNNDGAVRPPKKINPDNATEIQKLYRRNRKKALRKIFDETFAI